MTQPNLLELAEQGDPQAIANLMNLTLEPKGVTAKAFLEENCLHIFLSSNRALNAQTLVDFTRRGILSLGIELVEQVKLYGQRTGEDHPLWVEDFAVNQVNKVENDVDEREASETSTSATLSHSFSHSQIFVKEWLSQWIVLKPHLQSSLSSALVASQQLVSRIPNWRKLLPNESSNVAPAQVRFNYLKLSMVVTLVAFVMGATAALIANSYAVGSSEQKAGGKTAIAAGSQMAVKSDAGARNQQQAEARKYLETMNKAQQTFYRQNNRFAANLEELERSAAIPIASRSNYTYKLTVHATQSQLTAVSKTDGFKSYTAVASLAKSTNRVITAICASQQAAKVPPLVFQAASGAVECPIEPAKAL